MHEHGLASAVKSGWGRRSRTSAQSGHTLSFSRNAAASTLRFAPPPRGLAPRWSPDSFRKVLASDLKLSSPPSSSSTSRLFIPPYGGGTREPRRFKSGKDVRLTYGRKTAISPLEMLRQEHS
eukprot:6816766-Prymnesium_polylepis.1